MSLPYKCQCSANVDDRGVLFQIYGDPIKVPFTIKRIYIIKNFSRGTIRGLHYHKYESKAYVALNGAAKFIIKRPDQSVLCETISSTCPQILVIPPGYPHGWISLTDRTLLLGMSDKSLEESKEDDQRMDPMELGKEIWEVKPR
jgi:dTDP-4-dehydrorhamnose 3,5-epimerase-like enzyme